MKYPGKRKTCDGELWVRGEKSLDRWPAPRCGDGVVSGHSAPTVSVRARPPVAFPVPRPANVAGPPRPATPARRSGLCDTWPDAHCPLETLSHRNSQGSMLRPRTDPPAGTGLPVPRPTAGQLYRNEYFYPLLTLTECACLSPELRSPLHKGVWVNTQHPIL